MTIQEIDQRIDELREKYKNYPEKRLILKRQARALQIAKEKKMEKQQRIV